MLSSLKEIEILASMSLKPWASQARFPGKVHTKTKNRPDGRPVSKEGMHPGCFFVQRGPMSFRFIPPHATRDTAPSEFARRLGRRLGLVALFASLLCAGLSEEAFAKPKTHTVYSGQRLGSIAKRYNVTVDELCQANGISRSAPIKPGQKLIIPGTDDGTGSAKSEKNSGKKSSGKANKPQGKVRFHVVAKGHTLSAIAGRYAITVTSLCNANGISRNASLTVGERLIVPAKDDKNGEYAKQQRLRGKYKERAKQDDDDEKSRAKNKERKSWKKYEKPAWRRGYIKIARYGRSWEGYVIGPKNQVLGHASNKINFVMGAREDGPRIDPKLIRLIASISDNFGGREIRIVSGYRTKSFVAASKHKKGKAIDFSIPGIPNEVLRDYLRTIDNVGVGYYPNSSFVHLDVRGYNSYWVDHAGPGEAPRKRPKSTKKSSKKSSSKKAAKAPAAEEQHDHSHDESESAPEKAPAQDE